MFKKSFSKFQTTTYLLLTAILLLGSFLRFYRLPDMANYDFDQEYAANFGYLVVHDGLKLLIGQGLSVEGLFMGPWYFYYLTPFFALTNLHPLGGYIGSSILGLIMVLAYFFTAKKMFGDTAGLIAAGFRAFTFIQVGNDWTMVPAYGSDLSVILTWYCFYQYWHGQTRILPLLFFVLGLFTSFHPILFPFYIITTIFFLIIRQLPNLKIIVLSIFAFAIPQAPLILFEHWHSWLEVKRLISLFSASSTETKDPVKLLTYLQLNFSEPQRLLNLQFLPTSIFLIFFFAILAYLISKKIGFWKDKFHLTMFAITFIAFIFYYYFFPTHVPEYYFNPITTLTYLYVAAALSLLATKRFATILIFFLLFLAFTNLRQFNDRWNNPSLITLSHKDAIVKEIINHSANQPFYLSYIKSPGWNFGFEYLFKLYGHTSSGNREDPVYTIVIPKEMSPDSIQFSSGNIGLIYPNKKP